MELWEKTRNIVFSDHQRIGWFDNNSLLEAISVGEMQFKFWLIKNLVIQKRFL